MTRAQAIVLEAPQVLCAQTLDQKPFEATELDLEVGFGDPRCLKSMPGRRA